MRNAIIMLNQGTILLKKLIVFVVLHIVLNVKKNLIDLVHVKYMINSLKSNVTQMLKTITTDG